MVEFLISLLFGMLPDVIYTWMFVTKIKNIKSKKLLFFLLIFILYFVCITQIRYQLLLYLTLDILIYIVMKLMYKAKITDFFLIIVLDLYLFINSILCYFAINNYIVALIINRILLFIPLIWKNKLANLYNQYCKLWNRHNIQGKIKSITIRNIVLVLLHIMIIIFHIGLIYISGLG